MSPMNVAIESLRKQPVAEKLRIVEALWDDIGAPAERIELDSPQFSEGKKRAEELRANPSITISRDEFWRRRPRKRTHVALLASAEEPHPTRPVASRSSHGGGRRNA